ncbi:MAG: flagellar biosynthesis protein FlhF [Spirochaetes bacterium]|nr:flagellar biosynthesis protein FlhF [Spirochaetota bacterium]
MEMYVERGLSKKDCEQQIMQKYGDKPFQILEIKPVKIGGFLGLGGKDGVEVGFIFTVVPKAPPSPAQSLYTFPPPPAKPAAERESQIDFEKAKSEILALAKSTPSAVAAKEAEKKQLQMMESLVEGMAELKEKIESGGAKTDEHPSFAEAARRLRLNEFSQSYTEKMLERMRKELPTETLDNFDAVQERLLEWIGESINIYEEPVRRGKARRARVMVLIGPTGVGKTTTIAKLAAGYGFYQSKRVSIRMITIDQYRIGAIEQLEAFGKIMEIPVSCPNNKLELENEIENYIDATDLFLVDTFGESPKDSAKLLEMQEFLTGCPRYAEYHLAFSASTKNCDMEEILRRFDAFDYRSVVLTKWDETNHIGNVISALAEKGKSISFITDGQEALPKNIKKASVLRFLTNLEDFKVNREKIQERFPEGGADQAQWG